MKHIAFLGLGLLLAGCGYQPSPSPYSLLQPLTVSVPMAVNQSRYGDLGPRLTREVIGLLDSSSNVTVRETAPATLKLAIIGVSISGGSWNPNRNVYDLQYDLPAASASRVVSLTVEAVLEKTGAAGAGVAGDGEAGDSMAGNGVAEVEETGVGVAVVGVAGGGAASARRLRVSSQRNFYVNDNENQTQLLEAEAFNWVLADLAQKITQGLFSEF